MHSGGRALFASSDAPSPVFLPLEAAGASPSATAAAAAAGGVGDTSSDGGPFECHACTYLNTCASASRCELCGTPRPHVAGEALRAHEENMKRAAAEAHAQQSWLCQQCTFMNRKTREVCSMCGAGTRAESEAATAALTGTSASAAAASSTPHRSKRRKGNDSAGVSDVDDADGADGSSGNASADGSDEMSDDEDGPASAAPRKTVKAKRTAASPHTAPFPIPTVGGSFSPSLSAVADLSLTTPTKKKSSSSKKKKASASSTKKAELAKKSLPALTNEDSRPELTDEQAIDFYTQFGIASMYWKAHREETEKDDDTATDAQRKSILAIVRGHYDALEFRAPAAVSAAAASASPAAASACTVCFAEFEGDDAAEPARLENCGHAHLCHDCFRQYVAIKIKDGAVTPWMVCPTPDCRHPLTPADLTDRANLTTAQLAYLAFIYSRKRLVRNESFVSCQTTNCSYGFLVPLQKNGKPAKAVTKKCQLCDKSQSVERGKEGELDPEFKKMIANGTLRECPKCKHLTMKEKGVCNVITCVKCAIVWNWATRETGKDSQTLKNKARMNGTLWQPGELEYQLNLQRTNLPEFKKLLERNGQAYDPNYVRGHG